ncbi:hypothetical protein FB567DRAFT_541310 [Paraphoma chrysanthemicola]|uniref:Zn(2)-C6 fungal-type domain-containing protein n=1 Tax=Paraphoma chrysanthemicola TaxID=798071 RepID=A0A8K0QU99_9PLEO|nr:hypothetical protein FB567DRAFT_541310 [Paraphoma chrysanthemicola]
MASASVDLPSSSNATSERRTVTACSQCKVHKRRCDGALPACRRCLKLFKTCTYEERRHRGPGKAKLYVQQLEQRLRSVEKYIEKQPPSQIVLAESEQIPDEHRHNETSEPTGGAENHGDHTTSSSQIEAGILDKDDSSASPQAPTQTAPDPTPGFPLGAFASELETARKNMLSSMDKTPFRRRIFASLPGKTLTTDLVHPIVCQIQPYGQVFSAEYVLHVFIDQDSAGQSNHSDNASRWAFVNASFARGMLERIDSRSFATMSTLAWTHFKNAFDVFPELIIQTQDFSACETLLAMALFTLCSADDQTSSQLTGAAARVVLGLGMHQEAYYSSLNDAVAEQHRRIFWLTFILNIDLMHRCALPSPIRHNDISAELPGSIESVAPRDGLGSTLLRHRAELSIIQSRMYELLHQRQNLAHQLSLLRLEAIHLVWIDLQSVRESIKALTQRSNDGKQGDTLSVAEISLIWTYESCAMKLHMAAARTLRAGKIDSHFVRGDESLVQAYLFSRQAPVLCYESAHDLMRYTDELSTHPFPSIWATLCFLLSAILALFRRILDDPTSQTVGQDSADIASFVHFLYKLKKQGSRVETLIDGCIKIHNFAVRAVSVQSSGATMLDSEREAALREEIASIESIRNKLSQVDDFLHLAQGLLSNIPGIRNQAAEVLSDILGEMTSNDAYGCFVPEIMKSATHNFSYGV